MKTSEKIDQIAPKLVAVQTAMKGIAKTATNLEFSSRYITLDTIVSELRPLLAAHKLMVMQGSVYQSDEALSVETTVLHESGQWITKSVVMPMVGRMLKGGEVSDPTPQTLGSAMSYGRRYGLAGFFMIASDEDDDGNAASRAPVRAAARQEIAQARAQAPATASHTLPDTRSTADEVECPKCGGRTWDNRATKKNPKAPDFKCRDRACDGVVWPPKDEPVGAGVQPGRESAKGPFTTTDSSFDDFQRAVEADDSDLPF
jgi:hypothetical protein